MIPPISEAAHVKARKLSPREKRRGVAQRKDTPEILSAPLAGNRTARKLHFFFAKKKVKKRLTFQNLSHKKNKKTKSVQLFGWKFSQKDKKSKGFDFLNFRFFRLFRWFVPRKIRSVRLFGFSMFRLFEFLNFHFFDFSNITLLAWELFDFLTFRFFIFVWVFDFSVFFFDFLFLRFSIFRRFAQKKESFDLWLGNSKPSASS